MVNVKAPPVGCAGKCAPVVLNPPEKLDVTERTSDREVSWLLDIELTAQRNDITHHDEMDFRRESLCLFSLQNFLYTPQELIKTAQGVLLSSPTTGTMRFIAIK